ncbi:MAG: PAS domain S-box protein, partial [Desulfopila sp.]|nr:PAS domain S-box protein [Desulfopila sp.]
MNTSRNKKGDELRRRAEELLVRAPGSLYAQDLEEVRNLAHELAVHQAELELQNEELAEAQLALQEAKERFAALYEYAPVGYVVLDVSGTIRRTNATWCTMLNRHEDFRGAPFAEFITDDDKALFLARFRVFFRNPTEKQIVVRIKRREQPAFYARIEARPTDMAFVDTHDSGKVTGENDRKELLVIVSDVSDEIAAKQQVEKQNTELREVNSRLAHIYRVLLGIRNVNQMIISEKDPCHLVRRACANLVQTMGYGSAWVVLLNEDNEVVEFASSGLSEEGKDTLWKQLSGKLFPVCMEKALQSDNVVLIQEPAVRCLSCPLSLQYSSRAGLSRCLRFQNETYGVMNVSVPENYVLDSEEHALFAELAGDLAFALYNIDVERRLKESQQRYLEIFEKSRDGFVMMGGTGRILDANPAYCEMLGYTLAELRDLRGVQEITAEHWREWEKNEIWQKKLFLHGNSGIYEKEYVRKDGALLPVELRSYAIRLDSGEIDHIWATVRDISWRKEASEELVRRENQLQRIFEILPIGLWFADKNGTLLRGNPAGVNIWGAEPHVPLTEYGIFKAWRLPERIPVQGEDWALARTIRQGVTVLDELLEIESFDGKRKVILNYTAPVLDDKGNVDGAIVVNLDISERKNLEAQLVQAQKMESVGRLAGGVAHDFNNMLGVILGHAELAQELVDSKDPVFADLQEIIKAAQRSADLTRQLLAFARKQTIAPKVLNVNTVVSGLLKMLQRLIGEDIELVWIPAATRYPVKVDPSQINQILVNLCVNSRDAINGIGTIIIETADVVLDEEYCSNHSGFLPGEYVMLMVSDDGCGMDRQILEVVYEPFFTTKEMGKGTGLGLATVYGIVKQNDGFINVYSEPDRGTVFKIYLPAHKQKELDMKIELKQKKEPLSGSETILLVEDEKSLLGMTRKMLEKQGYFVLAASGPTEALHLAQQQQGKIHLLLS